MRLKLLTLLLLMITSGVSPLVVSKTKLRTIFVEMQPILLFHDVDRTGTDTWENFTTWHCNLQTGYVFKKSSTDLFYFGLSITPPQFNVNEEFAYSGISLLVGRLVQIQYDVLYFRTQLGVGACRTTLPGIVQYDAITHFDFGLRLTLTDSWYLSLDLQLIGNGRLVVNGIFGGEYPGALFSPGISLGVSRDFNF